MLSRDSPAKRGESCPYRQKDDGRGGWRERQTAETDSRAVSSAAGGRVPSPRGHIRLRLSFLPACLEDNIPLNGVRGDGGREERMGKGVHEPRYKGTLEGWMARWTDGLREGGRREGGKRWANGWR